MVKDIVKFVLLLPSPSIYEVLLKKKYCDIVYPDMASQL